jgi:hypothetical protein
MIPMMLANLLKAKPAPNSAIIAVRLKKIEGELASAKAERASILEARKDLLLRGSDDDLTKFDAEMAQTKDRLDRTIKDAEYLVPTLKEEHRIASETEKTAAIEEEKKSAYAEGKAAADAFKKRMAEIERTYNATIAIVKEERNLNELIGKVNRNLPVGAEPLQLPTRAARYSPAPALPRLGKVLKSRRKRPIRDGEQTLGGPDAYETFETDDEHPPFGGEPAFDPDPLFRAVTLPPFRKGGPSFRPG